MATKIKISGSYVDPSAIKVKVNGAYADPVGIYAKVDGVYIAVAGGAQKSLRPVASNYRFHRDLYNNASFDSYANRLAVYITNDTDYLQLSWYLWYFIGTRPLVGVLTTNTIKNVAIDTGAGVAAPVTFDNGASRSKVLSGGNSNVLNDKLYASAVGLTKFLKGSTVFIKFVSKAPALNAPIPYSQYRPTGANEQVIRYNELATFISDAEVPGNFTTTGVAPSPSGNPYMTPVVLGEHGNPVGVIIGDSIANGSLDMGSYYPFDYGYFARSLRQADNSNPRPSLNMGIGGSVAAYIYSSSDGPLVEPYLAMSQFCELETFTNDVIAGRTLAYCQGVESTLIAFIKSQMSGPIIQSGVMTITSSTDLWATQGNQTVSAPWLDGAVATQLNAHLAAQVGTLIDVFFDNAAILVMQDGSRKWITDGTAYYAARDSTHPSTNGHLLLTNPLRTIVDNLIPFVS